MINKHDNAVATSNQNNEQSNYFTTKTCDMQNAVMWLFVFVIYIVNSSLL